jgi:hypothetical protein
MKCGSANYERDVTSIRHSGCALTVRTCKEQCARTLRAIITIQPTGASMHLYSFYLVAQ